MTSAPDPEPVAAPAPPVVLVAALWQVGSDLVMVRERSGDRRDRWRLPGGDVRAGETLAEAVVRTVDADTCADALCGPFAGWNEVVDDDRHTLTMYFEAVVLDPPPIDRGSGAMEPGLSAEEVRAVPDWEVSELPVVPGLAEFLADQGLIELVV